MSKNENLLEKIFEIATRRGFFIPTAEIYGGLAGAFDYGPIGTLMKRKIERLWREIFIVDEDNVWEIDGNVILPERVLIASGHVDNFVEPVTQCKKCSTVYRADKLVEELLNISGEGRSPEELQRILAENNIKCPACGGELGEVRVFNVMFSLFIGPTGRVKGYLRPETAQNIFINFNRIWLAVRAKLPFAIAQIGKSFRNEISPRQFLYRLREFTQMEIEQFGTPEIFEKHPRFHEVADIEINFVPAKGENAGKTIRLKIGEGVKKGIFPNEYFAYYIGKTYLFFRRIGIPDEDIRFREIPDNERPFYSRMNVDVEIKLSIGWKEVEGTAYRTDYDLTRHSQMSGTKLAIQHNGKMVIPEVVEASFGIERTILAILEKCYRPENYDRPWAWFAFPPHIAPVSVAIYPLLEREEMVKKAKELYRMMRKRGFDVIFDAKGSIGKRYARADEIGVPFCVTIDHETLENGTVTIRDRDTKEQVRVPLEELMDVLDRLISSQTTFEELKKKYMVVKK
ncbi:MAG: glycine--tRNA ligase [Candidatus Njordarchaeales archaeon]